jgi:elongator complex protein 3
VIEATKLLKGHGFAITYHMMLGMVGQNIDDEIKNIMELFSDNRFCPDYLKIFPCIAVKDTVHNVTVDIWFKKGWYPLTNIQTYQAVKYIMENLPPYIGINRISRIVSEEKILFGPNKAINVEDFKNSTQCVWTRSLLYNQIPNYNVSDRDVVSYRQGNGYFYKLAIDDVIYGFIRLEVFEKVVLIRDFRVTGEPISIGEKNDFMINSAQHIGVGRILLKHITNEFPSKDIEVIPPYGAYEYFIKNGFNETNNKLVKKSTV